MYENWQIETTMHCDLKCRHCLIDNDVMRSGVVENSLRDIVTRVSSLGAKNISFTGGEPFMAKDLVDACVYSRSLGISPALITNGQIASELNPNIIADTFRIIGVSIEGSAEIHDYIRGKGTYVRAIKFIRSMLERKVHVVVYIVINSINLDKLDQTLMGLVDMGVSAFHINQLNIQGNAIQNKELHFALNTNEVRKLVLEQVSKVIDISSGFKKDVGCSISKDSLYLDRFANIYSCVELSMGGYPAIVSLFDEDVEIKLDRYFENAIRPLNCSYEMLTADGLTIALNLGDCPLLKK